MRLNIRYVNLHNGYFNWKNVPVELRSNLLSFVEIRSTIMKAYIVSEIL